MSEKLVVYQVMNLDREEIVYGTTAGPIDAEVERLRTTLRGPTRDWKQADQITGRALTDSLDPRGAHALHRQFETGTPPNQFKVLKTYQPA